MTMAASASPTEDGRRPSETVRAARRAWRDGRVAARAVDELVALPDLPVAEAHDERTCGNDEHDQEQEQAAPRICSTEHGVSLASGRG